MKKKQWLVFIVLIFFSCSPRPAIKKTPSFSPKKNIPEKKIQLSQKKSSKRSSPLPHSEIEHVPVINPPIQSITYRKKTSAKKEEQKIKISVENMPLNKFINFIFAKTLKLSYFMDKEVERRKDPVTLNMEEPVSESDFLNLIYEILSRYRVSVQKKANTYFILPSKGIKEKAIAYKFFIGRYIPTSIPGTELITAIIPFYYVNASYYTNLITKLALSDKASIDIIPFSNALIITDMAFNIRHAIKVINLFDRLGFKDKKARLIYLDYLSPKHFIEKLKKILPAQGIPISSRANITGIILIPLPELSSILVVAPEKKWIDTVYYWKKKLDTITALGDTPQFFVFYPKNRRASSLAEVLSKTFGFIATKKKKNKSSETVSEKIVVDEDRNALVILATPSEYKKIKEVLQKLDTLPKQVLIEVTIAEVTLTKDLQYGVEWYIRHTGKYTGEIQTLGSLGIGGSGLTYSVVSDTQKFKALLNAFARDNLINVISTPRLVVLDNHEATINVGTQVPVITSEVSAGEFQVGGTSSLLRSVQYRNTGVILHIKPTINSGGILTLDINQEVSEPQVNTTSKIDSPIILNRSISTSVVMKNGTSLLLGGLIKKNKSKTVNKVPVLGDIPLLGYLFKSTSEGITKTELIVEITPYILSDITEAKEKTESFKSLLKWLNK